MDAIVDDVMSRPLTGIERLRLFASSPGTFDFDEQDADQVLDEIDSGVAVWFKVAEVAPPQKKLLMVTGSSGYRTHQQFLQLAYVDENYRPAVNGKLRWQAVTNDALSDAGFYPTHWAFPINLPVAA